MARTRQKAQEITEFVAMPAFLEMVYRVNRAGDSVSESRDVRRLVELCLSAEDPEAGAALKREAGRRDVLSPEIAFIANQTATDVSVLLDPQKLEAEIKLREELVAEWMGNVEVWKSLGEYLRIEKEAAIAAGQNIEEQSRFKWNFEEFFAANQDRLSVEGVRKFIYGLNAEQIATVKRMKMARLVLVLDMPYLDYYETEEDAESKDKTKMKPGLITLSNEVFKSKGLYKMSIDSDDDNYLKKYFQGGDDKRIKEQNINRGKVTVELKWSIQEGSDKVIVKYADGTKDDVNAEWGERVKKAREQGVETTYMTHIPSQLRMVQNGLFCQRVQFSTFYTLMIGDELKDGRVGRVTWYPDDGLRVAWCSADTKRGRDVSVRLIVIQS